MIVDIATVAQGVDICVGAGGLKDVAEGIVFIICCRVAVDIHQPDYVALEVRNVVVNYIVVVGRITVAHGNRDTIDVIGEVQNVVTVGHADKLRAVVIVAVHHTVYSLAGSQAVGIVRYLCYYTLTVGISAIFFDNPERISPPGCPCFIFYQNK